MRTTSATPQKSRSEMIEEALDLFFQLPPAARQDALRFMDRLLAQQKLEDGAAQSSQQEPSR